MINKIYKKIHNEYSTLFKFIFFLRYLVGIFFISAVLFIFIPHFFEFEKREEIIKNQLLKSYGLKLNEYKSIKYISLPIPNLEIQSASLSTEKDDLQIAVNSLNIYPKVLNIYNYENFELKKIIFNKNKILLNDFDVKILFDYIYNLKNRLTFKNLNLEIHRKNESLINLKKINFSNYGYNSNIFKGEVFDKKFKILLSDNYKKINFQLLNTGIVIDINLNEVKNDSAINGVLKSKFLNSNVKFNFDYDGKKIKIYNSYFRNKNLSFKNESEIIFRPFFYLKSIIKIEDINTKLLKKININKIFSSKNLIKKINTTNEIKFKSKKFSKRFIDDFNLNIDLAYGRLTYLKTISISDNFFKCQGDMNLLTEYPILYFDCSIKSKDKKSLLKKFSIKYKNKNELFTVNSQGNINILNNKINFKNISMNQNYKASKEDLNYFKQSFETILFNKDFLNIFDFKKIREFIVEIT
ncbi:hypothetical protein OAS95_01495 [Pelagibacteraceae bacterium]|nr:hypothetical protein [Pelagibacteraceae bacterium]